MAAEPFGCEPTRSTCSSSDTPVWASALEAQHAHQRGALMTRAVATGKLDLPLPTLFVCLGVHVGHTLAAEAAGAEGKQQGRQEALLILPPALPHCPQSSCT